MKSIASMRNLGPTSARLLAHVDIFTPDDLHQVGAVDAYKRVWEYTGKRPSLNLLWALHGALNDCDWKNIDKKIKKELKNETLL